ncbi:MDR/zinc-dependent alcohol dehydrogenase-like family protein [Planctomicrobium piriforme]|uniref:Threonine dehydrogenase n=1 Tax=Planctomicrobium piriforme TaxID=1576369 RepID=A0A1I3HIT2_9PLAN|nr:alcohol dehydrogenase catalytic domain-containing protein [Planctomicrobium piriforme]SFI35592.1 Threonine dehydrogenase [Planctomicrobium piriforme]
MRAVVLTEDGLEFRGDCIPATLPGQVPIRVLTAGICETDLQLFRGYMGFRGVLGHEFVGVAEAGKFVGQRVAGEINCACDRCETCRAGLRTHCPHRTVLGILNQDGAFADRVWLPEANLHPIPDNVSNDAAVFVEPLAAAFQIPAQLNLKGFRDIVVLGDGRLGNLCAQVLALHGRDPLVIGKHDEKLSLLQKLGIRIRRVDENQTARQADLVVDCTGSASGFADACRLVRPRGTIVLKTTVAGTTGPNLAPVVIDEINVIGSRCGPFPPAIAALTNGDIEVTSLITGRYPIEQAVAAFEQAQRKGQLKVLIDVSG